MMRLSAIATIVAAEPMVQVALAPGEGASSAFAGFATAQAAQEEQGLATVHAAMDAALAVAQNKINAALHGSFLQKGSPILIKVADGPESLSTGAASSLEQTRASMESKAIAQSAAEFDALTDSVVSEIRRVRSSFLQTDVKVKASSQAWQSTSALLRGAELARDSAERAFNGKVLALQKQYLNKLNAMIAKSMGSSFAKKGYMQPIVARIMGADEAGAMERTTQAPLVFLHEHSSFLQGKADEFIAAHIAVRKALHNGGCARNYSGCPVGFKSSGNGCAPAAAYNGFCGARDFSGMSQADKESWAWKCGASWACA